ncbi:LysR family transcriptional regulator [Thioclava sp. BHET1]|nr:LysR family transcriptional regulator [Thioclava sp. BHET1]
MIEKLEMFIALAKEQHFGRAAEICGVTQPTLSVAIRQLEEQLGVMLVWRGSRFGGLTPEGQRVLEWARRIVGDTRTMREEMRAARQGLAGRLRLAVIPTALTVASQLSIRFTERHPNVRLSILARNSGEILSMLDNLEIEAGVTYLDNEPLGRVSQVSLYRETYHLVCRKGHRYFDRDEISWAELAEEPLCLLTPDMQNRRIIDQLLHQAGVEDGPVVEADSTVVLMVHVMSGARATILPGKLAEFHSAEPGLASIPIRAPQVDHQVGLIAPYREPHTPVLAALLNEARAIAEK